MDCSHKPEVKSLLRNFFAHGRWEYSASRCRKCGKQVTLDNKSYWKLHIFQIIGLLCVGITCESVYQSILWDHPFLLQDRFLLWVSSIIMTCILTFFYVAFTCAILQLLKWVKCDDKDRLDFVADQDTKKARKISEDISPTKWTDILETKNIK